MPEAKKARAVGINHVALEVGEHRRGSGVLRSLVTTSGFAARAKVRRSSTSAINSSRCRRAVGSPPTTAGILLVVDDKRAVREALADAGIEPLPGPFLHFVDPWGNRIEIVGYDNIQFTKAPNVLRGMGLAHLSKNETAIKELTDKGMGPD